MNNTLQYPTRKRIKVVMSQGNKLGKDCDEFRSSEEQVLK